MQILKKVWNAKLFQRRLSVAVAVGKDDFQKYCVAIFNDFNIEEIEKMPVSVRNAWAAGGRSESWAEVG